MSVNAAIIEIPAPTAARVLADLGGVEGLDRALLDAQVSDLGYELEDTTVDEMVLQIDGRRFGRWRVVEFAGPLAVVVSHSGLPSGFAWDPSIDGVVVDPDAVEDLAGVLGERVHPSLAELQVTLIEL